MANPEENTTPIHQPVPVQLLEVQYIQRGEEVYKVLVPSKPAASNDEDAQKNLESETNPIICKVQALEQFSEEMRESMGGNPFPITTASFSVLTEKFSNITSLVKLPIGPSSAAPPSSKSGPKTPSTPLSAHLSQTSNQVGPVIGNRTSHLNPLLSAQLSQMTNQVRPLIRHQTPNLNPLLSAQLSQTTNPVHPVIKDQTPNLSSRESTTLQGLNTVTEDQRAIPQETERKQCEEQVTSATPFTNHNSGTVVTTSSPVYRVTVDSSGKMVLSPSYPDGKLVLVSPSTNASDTVTSLASSSGGPSYQNAVTGSLLQPTINMVQPSPSQQMVSTVQNAQSFLNVLLNQGTVTTNALPGSAVMSNITAATTIQTPVSQPNSGAFSTAVPKTPVIIAPAPSPSSQRPSLRPNVIAAVVRKPADPPLLVKGTQVLGQSRYGQALGRPCTVTPAGTSDKSSVTYTRLPLVSKPGISPKLIQPQTNQTVLVGPMKPIVLGNSTVLVPLPPGKDPSNGPVLFTPWNGATGTVVSTPVITTLSNNVATSSTVSSSPVPVMTTQPIIPSNTTTSSTATTHMFYVLPPTLQHAPAPAQLKPVKIVQTQQYPLVPITSTLQIQQGKFVSAQQTSAPLDSTIKTSPDVLWVSESSKTTPQNSQTVSYPGGIKSTVSPTTHVKTPSTASVLRGIVSTPSTVDATSTPQETSKPLVVKVKCEPGLELQSKPVSTVARTSSLLQHTVTQAQMPHIISPPPKRIFSSSFRLPLQPNKQPTHPPIIINASATPDKSPVASSTASQYASQSTNHIEPMFISCNSANWSSQANYIETKSVESTTSSNQSQNQTQDTPKSVTIPMPAEMEQHLFYSKPTTYQQRINEITAKNLVDGKQSLSGFVQQNTSVTVSQSGNPMVPALKTAPKPLILRKTVANTFNMPLPPPPPLKKFVQAQPMRMSVLDTSKKAVSSVASEVAPTAGDNKLTVIKCEPEVKSRPEPETRPETICILTSDEDVDLHLLEPEVIIEENEEKSKDAPNSTSQTTTTNAGSTAKKTLNIAHCVTGVDTYNISGLKLKIVKLKPGSTYVKPDSNHAKPDSNYVKPDSGYVKPGSNYDKPNSNYVKPAQIARPQKKPDHLPVSTNLRLIKNTYSRLPMRRLGGVSEISNITTENPLQYSCTKDKWKNFVSNASGNQANQIPGNPDNSESKGRGDAQSKNLSREADQASIGNVSSTNRNDHCSSDDTSHKAGEGDSELEETKQKLNFEVSVKESEKSESYVESINDLTSVIKINSGEVSNELSATEFVAEERATSETESADEPATSETVSADEINSTIVVISKTTSEDETASHSNDVKRKVGAIELESEESEFKVKRRKQVLRTKGTPEDLESIDEKDFDEEVIASQPETQTIASVVLKKHKRPGKRSRVFTRPKAKNYTVKRTDDSNCHLSESFKTTVIKTEINSGVQLPEGASSGLLMPCAVVLERLSKEILEKRTIKVSELNEERFNWSYKSSNDFKSHSSRSAHPVSSKTSRLRETTDSASESNTSDSMDKFNSLLEMLKKKREALNSVRQKYAK